jgi:hypothetical protein
MENYGVTIIGNTNGFYVDKEIIFAENVLLYGQKLKANS